jgi:hypothetical protein
MSGRPPVTVWYEDNWVKIRARYCSGFVADLKNGVEKRLRRWDPATKLWHVDITRWNTLHAILATYYDVTDVEDMRKFAFAMPEPPTPEPPTPEPPTPEPPIGEKDPYATILSLASDEQLKELRRSILLTIHPDHGGSDAAMISFNMAWEVISKERGF